MKRPLLILLAVLLVTACSDDNELPSLPDPSLLNDDETLIGNTYLRDSLQLLEAKDYDKLEQLEATDAALPSPFASGTNPLFDFYHGIAFLSEDQAAGYGDRVASIRDWIAARPNSKVALTALADCLFYYSETGNGVGDLLQQARGELDLVSNEQDRDAAWYDIMVCVLSESGADQTERDQVTQDGITHFPDYIETYRSAAFYREPRWGGTNEASEEFIAQCADKVGGDEGDVLYARLAQHIWENNYDEVLFTDRKFSWPRVKRGMTVICNRYPHSTMALNTFFAFSALAHKREIALFMMDHLGDHYDPDAWPSRDYFDHFCGWVRNPCTSW